MKGFKLTINDHTISGGVEQGTVFLLVTQVRDEIQLDFLGSDDVTNQIYKWTDGYPVKPGDKLQIHFTTIESRSKPVAISEKPPLEDHRLEEYLQLKQRLYEKGLI
ncbi:hypothetical protein [uncultured Sunxiuqinia sp.]|uniref:hypothetical protein n=1 Tax=uncultured Sunxiuqinia sp. TaxID=1573825 RepID=UPI0030D91B72